MILTSGFSVKVNIRGKGTILFPDSERMWIPNNMGEQGVLGCATLLFEKCKAIVVSDLESYFGDVEDIALPDTIKQMLTSEYSSAKKLEILGNLPEHLHKEEINLAEGMKVIAGFKKNAVITEYHSEEYYHGIELEKDKHLTDSELMYEQIRLNSLCQKAVFLEMHVDGLVTPEFVSDRLEKISKKLALMKPKNQ